MSWQLKISIHARNDIESILDWTLEHFGQNQHDRYLELIEQALADLLVDPSGPRSRSRDAIQPNLRSLHIARRGKHARHLFFYRINPPDTVKVLRLLHDAMDIERHIPEE